MQNYIPYAILLVVFSNIFSQLPLIPKITSVILYEFLQMSVIPAILSANIHQNYTLNYVKIREFAQ